jgi:hypothetical protein
VLRPEDITPTFVIGNATVLLWIVAIGVAVSTLVPLSVTEFGELAALLVTVSVPDRVPAAEGVNVELMVQDAPGLIVPTHVPVAANSGLGDVVTWVTVSAAVPELVRVTVCAALVVPTVCAAKVKAAGARFTAATGTELPLPDNEMAGLVDALDATVSVAVRVPVADGVNFALNVQLAPGATVTAVAPTQVPAAVKSAALVPLLLIAEMVRLPEPVFVSITPAGTGVALVDPTCVEPKARAVAVAEIAAAVAAAGFAMYAAMSAASVLLTYAFSGFIRGTEFSALRMVVGFVPLRMLFLFCKGSGPWHCVFSEHD